MIPYSLPVTNKDLGSFINRLGHEKFLVKNWFQNKYMKLNEYLLTHCWTRARKYLGKIGKAEILESNKEKLLGV